jgi:hypothetical protein
VRYDGEVVRVAVGELVRTVERQRTGQNGVRRRDRRAGTWYPVSQRTGAPVSFPNSTASMNLVPLGVEKTTTRHPAVWHAAISSGTPSGAGAPLIIRYSTLAGARSGEPLCPQFKPFRISQKLQDRQEKPSPIASHEWAHRTFPG